MEKVQAGRVQAAARALQSDDTEQQPNTLGAAALKPRDWKHYIKMGACIAVPVLALVLVGGGGGAVLGWAGAVLPVLAIVACPLVMYFLMRSMTKMGHPGDHQN